MMTGEHALPVPAFANVNESTFHMFIYISKYVHTVSINGCKWFDVRSVCNIYHHHRPELIYVSDSVPLSFPILLAPCDVSHNTMNGYF